MSDHKTNQAMLPPDPDGHNCALDRVAAEHLRSVAPGLAPCLSCQAGLCAEHGPTVTATTTGASAPPLGYGTLTPTPRMLLHSIGCIRGHGCVPGCTGVGPIPLHPGQAGYEEELLAKAAAHAPAPPQPEPVGTLAAVLADVTAERGRQDLRWGGPTHDDEHDIPDWAGYLTEYIRKLLLCGADQQRHRLVQIAALAVAAAQSLDRRRIAPAPLAPPAEATGEMSREDVMRTVALLSCDIAGNAREARIDALARNDAALRANVDREHRNRTRSEIALGQARTETERWRDRHEAVTEARDRLITQVEGLYAEIAALRASREAERQRADGLAEDRSSWRRTCETITRERDEARTVAEGEGRLREKLCADMLALSRRAVTAESERDEAREQREDLANEILAERSDLAAANARAEEAERHNLWWSNRTKAAEDERDAREAQRAACYADLTTERDARLRAEGERDGWEKSAAHFAEGSDYYRGIVVQIGEMLGHEAKTADDGVTGPDVLCAKVAEIVKARLNRLAAAEAELAEWTSGKWCQCGEKTERHTRGECPGEAAVVKRENAALRARAQRLVEAGDRIDAWAGLHAGWGLCRDCDVRDLRAHWAAAKAQVKP